MKHLEKTLCFLFASLLSFPLFSQSGVDTIKLSQSNTGTTVFTCDGAFFDSAPYGNYQDNKNLSITICTKRTPVNVPQQRLSGSVRSFALAVGDTLRIYEGRAINASRLMTIHGKTAFTANDLLPSTTFQTSIIDTSGCMTFHFKSNNDNVTKEGWSFSLKCKSRCPFPLVAMDSVFTKYRPDGTIVTKAVSYHVDTTYGADRTGKIDSSKINIQPYTGIDLCEGDSVKLTAKVQYPEASATYPQSHATTLFTWDYGDGSPIDSIIGGTGLSVNKKWNNPQGYDLQFSATDRNSNCTEFMSPIRVRIATNPIKNVARLPDICSFDSINIITGNNPNSIIRTQPKENEKNIVEYNFNRVFIPDGPSCPTLCYEAPVTFTKFRAGQKLNSARDLNAVCVNMEHSFTSDIWIKLRCPSGDSVRLKFFDRSTGGGGAYMGLPLDNRDGSNKCDSNANPYGKGFTYCWSEIYENSRGELQTAGLKTSRWDIYYDAATRVTSGVLAGQPATGITGSLEEGNQIVIDSTQWDTTRAPRKNYFRPNQPFSGFIGCPLNGRWVLEVCDDYGIDNGYVFGWWLDLANSAAAGWQYHVGLDTVKWDGPDIYVTSDTTCRIAPSNAGNIVYKIQLVDEYGCQWDTKTDVNVVQTPIVNLGNDTALCESRSFLLDAGNPGAHAYIWDPTGDTTQTLLTTPSQNTGETKTYVVQVTNTNGHIYCYGIDSIKIGVYRDPTASFISDINPIEGCEPLTFSLRNTSSFADSYQWRVGSQTSTSPSPSFTLNRGMYDVSLIVRTLEGCSDTLSHRNLVNVFAIPKAEFSWTPVNPYATSPTVQFMNQTVPHYDNSSQYTWSIQTLKNRPDLRRTLSGFQPAYTWEKQPETSISGDYIVTLDAYTKTIAPSGHSYECHDTVSHTITIINDNLLFPNLVTANNDGINDVFRIQNLVKGQAFPDNELTIVDRWGRVVFFRQDIRNDNDFWNPSTTNSPSGTYFYHFEGRGPLGEVKYDGAVEVIR